MDLPSQHKLPWGLRLAKLGSEKALGKWKIGAALIDSGTVIVAYNKFQKTSPAHLANGYRYCDQSHAEHNIFRRTTFRGKELVDIIPQPSSKGVVYVYREHVRINPLTGNKLALARPCVYCYSFLKRIGIRVICYTTEGSWARERLI